MRLTYSSTNGRRRSRSQRRNIGRRSMSGDLDYMVDEKISTQLQNNH